MGFQIETTRIPSFTLVPDSFICTHMLEANGNFVKVYLYLLMAGQHSAQAKEISVSTLADLMECTENDIRRALRYWKKAGLLSLSEKDGEITSVALSNPEDTAAIPSTEHIEEYTPPEPDTPAPRKSVIGITTIVPPESSSIDLPTRHTYTPLQAEALQKDVEIDRAINMVEQLLGTPVSPGHLQLILYFMCDVGFSSELLVTLYQTALNKGKKQPRYIEAIGLDWARQGIHTPEEAMEESVQFNGRYALVARAFGIQGSLRPAERQIVDEWSSYQFSDSVIEEACRRTILQTGDANWNYASSILKDWHSKHVISLDDIEKCDASHKRQKKNIPAVKAAPRKNQFQNFPQRTYSANEIDSLEKKLLRGPKMKV